MTRVRSQLVPLGLLLLFSVFLAATAQAENGIVVIDPEWGGFEPRDATYDAYGNIVITGLGASTINSLWGHLFVTMRVLPDGALDPDFGSGGVVMTNVAINMYDGARACAVQSDGKIISAGMAFGSNKTGNDFALVRYQPDGSPDNTFNNKKGIVTTDFGAQEGIWDVAVQTDGKILATGHGPGFLTARYTGNGLLDTSFGEGGYVRTTFQGAAISFTHGPRVLPSADGIVVVGQGSGWPENSDWPANFAALARYDADGNPSGILGVVPPGPDVTGTHFGTAILDANDSILIGGDSYWYDAEGVGHSGSTIARLTPEGSLDPDFGEGGFAWLAYGEGFGPLHDITALAVQPDGKIVAAGYRGFPGGTNLVVARFNTDGSLDEGFGNTGSTEALIEGTNEHAVSVLIDPQGKILVVGRQYTPGTSGDSMVLLRYLSNGTLDTSFGGSTPPATPGITVTPTAGLVTTEAGGTASFSVVLDTQPTALVQIDVFSDNPWEGIVAGADPSDGVLTLYFDETDWDQPQTVTVIGVDDPVRDGDVAYSVILDPPITEDVSYSALNPADVSVVNKDNEKGKPRP